MTKKKFLIFDCDGVLVDSEFLANRVEVEIKQEFGVEITLEQQITTFTGLAANHPRVLAELEKLPPNYLEILDERVKKTYFNELTTITGIIDILEELHHIPKCVASNSLVEWLAMKLSITGIESHFKDAMFSGETINKFKPEPDLFLYSAKMMAWPIQDCLVVEDSISGVTAGKLAGMTVCGFLGGKHIYKGHGERLKSAGADFIVTDIQDLKNYVA